MTRLSCFGVLFCLALAAGAQTPAPSDPLRMEMVFWESVRNSTDPADFKAYLEKYPTGNFAALARNRLASLEKVVAPRPAAAPAPAPAARLEPAVPKRLTPAPLASGDSWTYRLVDWRTGAERGTQEFRLVSVATDLIVEEVLAQDKAAERFEHRRGLYVAAVGRFTHFSPYLLTYGTPQFNVRLGGIDNLDGRTCKSGWTCSVNGRTFGWERVRVPAGEFEAIKVEVYQAWNSAFHPMGENEAVRRTLTVWYSPDAKRAVKIISRGNPSANVETEYDLELVRYKVK
jgi:hypothetical protein